MILNSKNIYILWNTRIWWFPRHSDPERWGIVQNGDILEFENFKLCWLFCWAISFCWLDALFDFRSILIERIGVSDSEMSFWHLEWFKFSYSMVSEMGESVTWEISPSFHNKNLGGQLFLTNDQNQFKIYPKTGL